MNGRGVLILLPCGWRAVQPVDEQLSSLREGGRGAQHIAVRLPEPSHMLWTQFAYLFTERVPTAAICSASSACSVSDQVPALVCQPGSLSAVTEAHGG